MCQCYGLYDEDKIIGFLGVLHQPHPTNKKIKRVSRLVILPDYQGIGLGYKLLEFVAKIYIQQGYDFSIVTSAKNLIMKLYKSNKWQLRRLNAQKKAQTGIIELKKKNGVRSECKTASFFYRKNS